MKSNPTKQLDPMQHRHAVRLFQDFFGLIAKPISLEFLREILAAFAHLPYENISKIIKLSRFFDSPEHIRLPEEVMEDHIRARLGGTCYSLTFFLQCILSQHGFLCYPFSAHMRNRPNFHCGLIVLLDGRRYLVDPGYLLTQPMEIHSDKSRLYRAQHTGIELRCNTEDEHYHLYTFDRHSKKWRYSFRDRPVDAGEFAQYWQASFYQATMHGVCLTQVRPDGLVYLHNDYLQITTLESRTKRKVADDYYAVIYQMFGIAPELVEHAVTVIPENVRREKLLGIHKGTAEVPIFEAD